MEMMLQMMLTMCQEDQRVRQEEKREEREREAIREERRVNEEHNREERQLQLIAQLKEAQPAVPQQVTMQNHKLPQMNEKNDLEVFVNQLEAGLVSSDHRYTQGLMEEIPPLPVDSQCKAKVHAFAAGPRLRIS